ncbi:uncharacterized protein LOC108665360 [Hyalella azteca]|uniref:Uncharacterized protein LOC108665360 n=1 Tax=Hyalella azteca TaxID=294128 RepID=A0A8B7N186_HYAAZ|nr:uncharacterized protein LOC108665360 [Hyalella azteca]
MHSKKAVHEALHYVATNLSPFLALANCHLVDVFVSDVWHKVLPPLLWDDLNKISPQDLCSMLGPSQESSELLDGIKSDLPSLHKFLLLLHSMHLSQLGVLSSKQEVLAAAQQHATPVTATVDLQRLMPLKKAHEVAVMAELMAALCAGLDVSWVCDLGAGKGYLSALLARFYGLHVLAVDGTQSNTQAARAYSHTLQKELNRQRRVNRRTKNPSPEKSQKFSEGLTFFNDLEDENDESTSDALHTNIVPRSAEVNSLYENTESVKISKRMESKTISRSIDSDIFHRDSEANHKLMQLSITSEAPEIAIREEKETRYSYSHCSIRDKCRTNVASSSDETATDAGHYYCITKYVTPTFSIGDALKEAIALETDSSNSSKIKPDNRKTKVKVRRKGAAGETKERSTKSAVREEFDEREEVEKLFPSEKEEQEQGNQCNVNRAVSAVNQTLEAVNVNEAISAVNQTSKAVNVNEAISAVNQTLEAVNVNEAISAVNQTLEAVNVNEAICAVNQTLKAVNVNEAISAVNQTLEAVNINEAVRAVKVNEAVRAVKVNEAVRAVKVNEAVRAVQCVSCLHGCGDLSVSALHVFLRHAHVAVACVVGCCYHLVTERPAGAGFPLCAQLAGYQLGRNARMIGSQCLPRRVVLGVQEEENKSHFWRAVLQLVIVRQLHHSANPASGSQFRASGTPPCASGTPPCASGTPPCASGTQLCASGTHPRASGTLPCASGTLSCASGTPPSVSDTPPCASGTPSCASGTPPRASGTPPRTSGTPLRVVDCTRDNFIDNTQEPPPLHDYSSFVSSLSSEERSAISMFRIGRGLAGNCQSFSQYATRAIARLPDVVRSRVMDGRDDSKRASGVEREFVQ